MSLLMILASDPATKTLTPPIRPGEGLPEWVFTSKLVGKPDQLIKRRGKAGLLSLNKDWQTTSAWIEERAGKPVTVEKTTGTLNTFIIEPFTPHPADTEYYVCINSAREGDWILFTQYVPCLGIAKSANDGQ
jgi:ATP citrate (pro-S)-lyase